MSKKVQPGQHHSGKKDICSGSNAKSTSHAGSRGMGRSMRGGGGKKINGK